MSMKDWLPEDWARLGSAIRLSREAQGFSRRALSDLSGVSEKSIQLTEEGRVPGRWPSSLPKIEAALGWAAGSTQAVLDGREPVPAEVVRRDEESTGGRDVGGSWPERLVAVIAKGVKQHREARGMSVQQLADACAGLGMPISQAEITSLEDGGRRSSIGVADVLVLGAALKIPPVLLISPAGTERACEFLPGRTADPYAAALWMAGLQSDVVPEDAALFRKNPMPEAYSAAQRLRTVSTLKKELADLEVVAEQLNQRMEQAEAEKAVADARYAAAREAAAVAESDSREVEEIERHVEILQEAKSAARAALEATERVRVLADRVRDNEIDISSKRGSVEKFERWAKGFLREIQSRGWELPGLPSEFRYITENLDAEYYGG
ncbi:hypothetical protein ACFVY9_00615 [Streptomyces sp. NPDC059544]|uniref:hypothetical protein n=1 Tax=Streptomyces sp. NPDC059544 TaxID=3346861 RepID=UPI0036BD77EF